LYQPTNLYFMSNYIQPESFIDRNTVSSLAQELSTTELITSLLCARGVTSFQDAKDFFRPDLKKLHDPFLMKNMHHSVERLTFAYQNKEKILIFGDYDVDGTTAVAQMVLALSTWGFEVDFYIPDRYTEGYGVSIQGVEYALAQNCSIFMALDCGTKAVEKIAYAKEKRLDVIVCDHHKPGDKLPEAILLNHKQEDCPYPYKELTGCGIGFKLLQALAQKLNFDPQVYWDLLDLNALSIGADIVPVTGENRILAYHGLKQINEKPLRAGMRALLEAAKKSRPLTLSNVVFTIAPRINAAGRMEFGKTAVELMIEPKLVKARKIAQDIEAFNAERKELDREVTQEILDALENDEVYQNQFSTVVYGEHWKKGVIGIVASRLIENYYRPTIVLTKTAENLAAGSVRSVHDFDVYEALLECEQYLVQFGGHKYAAGLTIKIDKIDDFKTAFERYVAENIVPSQRIEPLTIDMELDLNDLFQANEGISPIPKFMRVLKQFEPHGPGNMRPVFLAKNCFLNPARTKVVGEDHLKTEIHLPNKGFGISSIGFGMGGVLELAQSGCELDVAFVLEENIFNNVSSLQAQIRMIRESEIA
jgi:single-stranded-DNA-specific exonuclease